MFWLAVSLAVVAPVSTGQIGRLGDREVAIWRNMEPSIVMLSIDGRDTGPAALVDQIGLFVANRNAVSGDEVLGRTYDGKTVHLSVKGRDSLSQLVLLQSADWSNQNARPFAPPSGDEVPGGALLAVLATGPIRAEFVSSHRYGVVQPSHRLVPLTEFRFEAPAEAVGTALVFCENHDLIGALHATLAQRQDTGTNPLVAQLASPMPGRILRNPLGRLAPMSIGPSQLTVAYAAGPDVIRRVLKGFRSPSHEVIYPTIGVFCTDEIGGGALVQRVTPDSPCAKAGFKPGDIIQEIAGTTIGNQVDFARVMLRQEIGQHITLRGKRGVHIFIADLTVARAG